MYKRQDDASDELTNDPVFKSVLEKDAFASQPTVSRFFNRMDEDTLNKFLAINRVLRKDVYKRQGSFVMISSAHRQPSTIRIRIAAETTGFP